MALNNDGSAFDQDVGLAMAASTLCDIPSDLAAQLLVDARRRTIAAGTTVHREGEDGAHLELMVQGLVRVHVTSRDGRTLTIRYCRRGDLIGAATMYARSSSRAFAVQALVDSELLRLRPEVVRTIADRDPRLAAALLIETSERVLSFIAELSDAAFSTVRRRVARHLLDLASEQQHGSELIARISQQQLADAVGAVREVVVPVLRELREAGVIWTGRDGITLLQPDALLNTE